MYDLRIRLYIISAVLTVIVFSASCKHRTKELAGVPKNKSKRESKTIPPANGNTVTIAKEGTPVLEQKLGLSSKEIKNSKLYSFVNEWYNTPYKYGGCQKTGVDCSCFADILYEEVYGYKLARTAGDMFNACNKISAEDAKEGDLFFFKINGDKISHVGVLLKRNFFVHSSTSKGVIISSLDEAYYKKYFFCAGRPKKV